MVGELFNSDTPHDAELNEEAVKSRFFGMI